MKTHPVSLSSTVTLLTKKGQASNSLFVRLTLLASALLAFGLASCNRDPYHPFTPPQAPCAEDGDGAPPAGPKRNVTIPGQTIHVKRAPTTIIVHPAPAPRVIYRQTYVQPAPAPVHYVVQQPRVSYPPQVRYVQQPPQLRYPPQTCYVMRPQPQQYGGYRH